MDRTEFMRSINYNGSINPGDVNVFFDQIMAMYGLLQNQNGVLSVSAQPTPFAITFMVQFDSNESAIKMQQTIEQEFLNIIVVYGRNFNISSSINGNNVMITFA